MESGKLTVTTSIFCRRYQGARHTTPDEEGHPLEPLGPSSTEPFWRYGTKELGFTTGKASFLTLGGVHNGEEDLVWTTEAIAE